MSSGQLGELVFKTILPLITSYMPIIASLTLAWITVSHIFSKNEPKRRENKTSISEQSFPKSFPKQQAVPSSKPPKKKFLPRNTKQQFSHDWLLTSLKGHNGTIFDMGFSANGKYLATCAVDGAIFLWSTKHFTEKDHKYLRYNVGFGNATHLTWSPDSKYFLYSNSPDVVLCKVNKKADGWISSVVECSSFSYRSDEEIMALGIDVNGRYLMVASTNHETENIVILNLKGELLTRIKAHTPVLDAVKVSPCGKYVGAAGFVPEVKVWGINFTKSGDFNDVSNAFSLIGHNSRVVDFSFNADSSRVVTVSNDLTWRLYNISVELDRGEDPKLLQVGKYTSPSPSTTKIAVSPDGLVIALATNGGLSLISADGNVDKEISDIYDSGDITRVLFDAAGDYILTSGKQHVRVFHNVTAHKVKMLEAKAKIKSSSNTSAMKERLQEIIDKSEAFLKQFNGQ